MTARTLYYAPGACSLACHVALEEVGLPFETVRLDLARGDQHGPEYLSVNDRGRVPALWEDGFVLTETQAILRHLARAHPEAGLWPGASREAARADEWLGWLSTNHHVAHAGLTHPERFSAEETDWPGIRARGADTFGDLCTMTEVYLSNGGWALQDYSVVDPYLLVFWRWGAGPGLRLDMAGCFPAWTQHARAVAERPAARRALAREGIALPT